MSEFFKDQGGSEEKSFIPPDYSELMKEEELPFDADLSGDDDDDDGELVSDEEIEHDKIVEELEEGRKPDMSFGSGFGSPSSKPTWGSGWGDQNNKQDNNWWGSLQVGGVLDLEETIMDGERQDQEAKMESRLIEIRKLYSLTSLMD